MGRKSKKEKPVRFISRILRRKTEARSLSAQEWFQTGFSIMHSTGECDRAIKAFSSCIQLDSSNVRAFLQRGISHECLKNTKAALADYSMAIELLPEDGKAYYLRGMLLWRLCDATAIDDLEKSAELGYRLARDFLRRKAS